MEIMEGNATVFQLEDTGKSITATKGNGNFRQGSLFLRLANMESLV